jgi:hydrogenase maturation protein HypF
MEPNTLIRQRVVLRGLVQGVGFRPFVCRLAHEHGLTGWVQNDADGASVEVQGSESKVAQFQRQLAIGPATARIESIQSVNCELVSENEFVIRPSVRDSVGVTCPPVDLAPCKECLAEFNSTDDRRQGYPFINCTDCGPRFTILNAMPFDRDCTSMNAFPLCTRCRNEFEDCTNRRFHAQAMACPDCGPQFVWNVNGCDPIRGKTAIQQAIVALAQGGVIALKGVGGFHLVCNGLNLDAVTRLRHIKRRPARPLALIASGLEMVREYAEVSPSEAEWLKHRSRPIVLLKSLHNPAMATAVAPKSNHLGFMLPYTPLHHMLMAEYPLVMTSGNLTGEPLIRDSAEARRQLGSHVVGILDHDRQIEVRCDDSLLQVVQDTPRIIRRSRGFVPEPFKTIIQGPCVLAVGGDFKNAPALAVGDRIYPGPHVGDLLGWSGLQALDDAVKHLSKLLHATPEAIACDAHPGYLSQRWANEYSQHHGIPRIRIDHHEAHAEAWRVDTGCERSSAIVVVFDGTGLGPDGTLWGSEFFELSEEGTAQTWARLKSVPLPGGDMAVRKPARMAFAHLHAAGLPAAVIQARTRTLTDTEQAMTRIQIERELYSPQTRSMGRLFDAVASLLGICQEATYEGQPAIELEATAEPTAFRLPDFRLEAGPELYLVNPDPVFIGIVEALENGKAVPELAYAFHIAVVRMIVCVLQKLRERNGTNLVGFSGGVFQNRLLEELLTPLLRADGFEARFHSRIPCNDGGLAVGQVVLARKRLNTLR